MNYLVSIWSLDSYPLVISLRLALLIVLFRLQQPCGSSRFNLALWIQSSIEANYIITWLPWRDEAAAVNMHLIIHLASVAA